MTTQQYSVTGLDCGHCEDAVRGELKALAGVSEVTVELVPDGSSIVTVTSDEPLTRSQVLDALDEAGDYELV